MPVAVPLGPTPAMKDNNARKPLSFVGIIGRQKDIHFQILAGNGLVNPLGVRFSAIWAQGPDRHMYEEDREKEKECPHRKQSTE